MFKTDKKKKRERKDNKKRNAWLQNAGVRSHIGIPAAAGIVSGGERRSGCIDLLRRAGCVGENEREMSSDKRRPISRSLPLFQTIVVLSFFLPAFDPNTAGILSVSRSLSLRFMSGPLREQAALHRPQPSGYLG